MAPVSPRVGVPAPHPSQPSDRQGQGLLSQRSSLAVADTSRSPRVPAFLRLEMLGAEISVLKHTVRTFKAFFCVGSV